ncbi:MAG: Txe/YoeB family addiction module toxin [Bacteroidetes bacterium]|nr:Txe/YoeB family addiction module toxin [Bacteroidota bacterium]
MRKVRWEKDAFQEMEEWKYNSPQIFRRIGDLIADTKINPFHGIGKPEPLKHHLKGCWSRRINKEHRLIYRITNDAIHIISCKGHYD